MNLWSRWDRKDPANTHTSLILKRQIPIRYDEEPRSWLGGLPMMPKGTKWPRDATGAPLQFLAQISCADLPQVLWNGLGPRRGWLLLFVNVLQLEDEADGGCVQVLYTAELGVEHQPPDDVPTVRHAMSDYIGRFTPETRPGVPKLWRKWPVDLVVQEYRASVEELEVNGPPIVSAEDLYQAPVSDHEITVHGGIPLDRPLTWRGALYVVEGVLRDLGREDLEREFVGAGGLLDAPEADQTEFNEEFDRRAATRQEFQDREVGWGPRVEAARAALNAELAGERKSGWIKRAFVALEREKLRNEGWLVEYQRAGQIDRANYQIDLLAKLEQHRAWLVQLQDAFPGPEGEARLNAEIKSLGEAHLAQLPSQRAGMKRLLSQILAQDLDAPLPDHEWRTIETSIKAAKSTYWRKTYDTRVLEKVDRSLVDGGRYVQMAVREDVLDLYTSPCGKHPAMTPAFIEEIEKKLRCMEMPHQMGGLARPIQGEFDLEMLKHDPIAFVRGKLTTLATPKLLFQIASDGAMGWMWGDVGALYVTVSSTALRLNRFKRVHAWIEGH